MTFDEAEFTLAGVRVVEERPAVLDLQGGVLTARDVSFHAGGSPLTVTGTAKLTPTDQQTLDLAVRGTSIAGNRQAQSLSAGVLEGVKDTFRHFWLVCRCSAVGVFVGIMPGAGGGVAQWMAYAHAVQSAKDSKDRERFGKGDVRGVLGPGAANNSKEGGDLVPTIAFGVPGIFMGIATFVFWLGRHRFKQVPPKPGGKLGGLDFVASALMFAPVVALIAAVFVKGDGFKAQKAAPGASFSSFYITYVKDYVSFLAVSSWHYFLIAFVLVYFIVFGAGIYYLLKLMQRAPQPLEPEPDPHLPQRAAGITPAPALEAQ